MTGFVGTVLTDQGTAQQVQVTHGIEHLVFDKLVVKAQTIAIENTVLIENDRVVLAAAAGEPTGAHVLELVHETEGPRTAHLIDKRYPREIQLDVAASLAEFRVVEIDGEGNLEAVKGQEGGLLVAIAQRDGALYAHKTPQRILLENACGLNKKNKRTGTAVHNRNFCGADVNADVVNTKTGQR